MNRSCGCYYYSYSSQARRCLPLVEIQVQSTILSTISRTTLVQTFINPFAFKGIDECSYIFPLFDGVSVAKFTCKIGNKLLNGVVKEKEQAKKKFKEAKSRGKIAGLLHMNEKASDIFTTKLGNIPANGRVIVEISYLSELKHHGKDGTRFTIPTYIAARYGSDTLNNEPKPSIMRQSASGINITIDIHMADGSNINQVESPSHPISVAMGINTLSSDSSALNEPSLSKACASLSLDSPVLESDFVLIVHAKEIGIPKAVCESHPTIPNHYAIMTSLAPRFNLPSIRPEIVFVADRSGSMSKCIPMLLSAMKVFLKSLPTDVKFNICSFGSTYSFLWSKSKTYCQVTLDEATNHLKSFLANMGGTEISRAIKATIDQRFTDLPLEIMLLTDGDIWQQEELFSYINGQVSLSEGAIRLFPLGIGSGVSHSLIEGVARAGNGFAQVVQDGERLDAYVIRMLRGALSPHISNYTLELKYDEDMHLGSKVVVSNTLSEDYEMIQSGQVKQCNQVKPTISLFDPDFDPEKETISEFSVSLPHVPIPNIIQAPTNIPPLFASSRTTVYLLMLSVNKLPTAVVLQAASGYGPLRLEIPIEFLEDSGETIHQLAARKAVQDLEEGRGWLSTAVDEESGLFIKDKHPSCMEELVKREAVRLGEKFQVIGKCCSFVAVLKGSKGKIAASRAISNLTAQTDIIINESEEDSDDFEEDSDECENYSMEAFSSSTTFDVEKQHILKKLANLQGTKLSLAIDKKMKTVLNRTTSGSSHVSMVSSQDKHYVRGSGGLSDRVFGGLSDRVFGGVSGRGIVGVSERGGVSAREFGGVSSQCIGDVITSTGISIDSTNDVVMALINLQKFEGCWTCTAQELSSILNLALPITPEGVDHAMWLTYIVVTFLETKCTSESETWELLVEKSREWIKTQGLTKVMDEMIKEKIAQILK